MTKTKMIIYIV